MAAGPTMLLLASCVTALDVRGGEAALQPSCARMTMRACPTRHPAHPHTYAYRVPRRTPHSDATRQGQGCCRRAPCMRHAAVLLASSRADLQIAAQVLTKPQLVVQIEDLEPSAAHRRSWQRERPKLDLEGLEFEVDAAAVRVG